MAPGLWGQMSRSGGTFGPAVAGTSSDLLGDGIEPRSPRARGGGIRVALLSVVGVGCCLMGLASSWVPLRVVAHRQTTYKGQILADDTRWSAVRWGWVHEAWEPPRIREAARFPEVSSVRQTVSVAIDWPLLSLVHGLILAVTGGALTVLVRRLRALRA